jgi:spermidine synthase
MTPTTWQQQNYAAIMTRLEWVRAQPDGFIFQKILPQHIVMVHKHGTRLSLALPCPVSDMVQSVMNLAEPLNLTAPYNQAFLLALCWQPQPLRIFTAGVGGGSLPLVLHHYLPETPIDCVDLDELVCEVAQKYFGLQPDHRLTITIQEARAYLSQTPHRYDIMFIDVFMGNGFTPYPVVTQEFYQLCQQRLTKNGVIVINIPHDEPWYADKVKTVQSIFQRVYICRVEMGNSAIIATNGNFLTRSDIMEWARQWQTAQRLPFSLLKRAQLLTPPSDLLEVVPHLYEAVILHDDQPPPNYPSGVRNER